MAERSTTTTSAAPGKTAFNAFKLTFYYIWISKHWMICLTKGSPIISCTWAHCRRDYRQWQTAKKYQQEANKSGAVAEWAENYPASIWKENFQFERRALWSKFTIVCFCYLAII